MRRNSKTMTDAATIAAPEADLSQFCLEPDPTEAHRVLAWVNSICLIYLVIGVLGLQPAAPVIHRAPSAGLEAAPTIIEPLVSAAQTDAANPTPEEAPSEKPPEENSAAVMVTLDSPAVAFSVPTIGNLLVPLAMAPAPPPKPMESVMPISAPPREPLERGQCRRRPPAASADRATAAHRADQGDRPRGQPSRAALPRGIPGEPGRGPRGAAHRGG